jgi:hypothetical protein
VCAAFSESLGKALQMVLWLVRLTKLVEIERESESMFELKVEASMKSKQRQIFIKPIPSTIGSLPFERGGIQEASDLRIFR